MIVNFNMDARYYDPEIGRFLSVDPLFEMYTEFSPYNCCNNSPNRKEGKYEYTLRDIVAHELGHLYHFLSYMYSNQIFGSILYKGISDKVKEERADYYMNAIIQELKILGITY
jgi:hypothetical protein